MRAIGRCSRFGNDSREGETRLIFGHLPRQAGGANPLNGHLLAFVHLHMADYEGLAQSEPLLDAIELEQRNRRPGWHAIVNQLIQTLFCQGLRAFASQHANGSAAAHGNQASLVTDPIIGLVVGLLHSQPEKPWTVASLARWVNMSRSAFSERFREVVGKPPLQYLTQVRMGRACELLARSDLGVKQIAGLVGYESPSSFTNAFKRWNGVSPVAYRDESGSLEPVLAGQS